MKRFITLLLVLCLGCMNGFTAWAEMEVFVPEAYTQTGTMPIYRAAARDFGADIRPELFNQSGIVLRDDWHVVFADEAILDWAPEALFYNEYSGTFDANERSNFAGGKKPSEPSIIPPRALSSAISGLASWASFGWPGSGTVYEMEKTALTQITLEQAQQTLETLLDQMQLTGYVCDYALDMSLERIAALGSDMNAQIAAGSYSTNIPPCDFDAATTADEGFYTN